MTTFATQPEQAPPSDPGESVKQAACACTHCGLPVPAGLVVDGRDEQFCCNGCASVYQLIHGCGLDAFYRLREKSSDEPLAPVRSADGQGLSVFDSEKFHELYVRPRGDGMRVVDLVLEGVHCAACVWLIEKLPRVVPGVVEARLSLRQATVRVTWDAEQVKLSQIAKALSTLGYTAHPARGGAQRGVYQAEQRAMLIRLGVAGAIAGNTMLLAFALYTGVFSGMEKQFSELFRWVSALLGVLSLAWPGRVFFRGAWAAIRTRSPHLDIPIALALGVGGIAGAVNVVLARGDIYFDSLAVLVFLLLVGRFIQYRQQRSAEDAAGLLFSMTPNQCRRVAESGERESLEEVPAEAVEVGDLLEVRSGELIPADGMVETGHAAVIAALITGEPTPVPVEAGDGVCAGARLVGATIRLRVTAVGEQSRIGRLMALMQQGLDDKPKIVELTDRVAGWFVGVVSLIALGVFAAWCTVGFGLAVDHTVALLIIACPCALGLATPLAIAVAIGRAAKRDILIKSGAALDRLSKPGLLLIDKTGTITQGEMRVASWTGDETLKPIIAQIERHATHPIARAIVGAFDELVRTDDAAHQVQAVRVHQDGLEAQTAVGSVRIGSARHLARYDIALPDRFVAAGQAASQQACTPVFVAVSGEVAACLSIGDALHDDSVRSLQQLRDWGWQVQMLTGDNRAVALQVGEAVGIGADEVFAEVTPEEKLKRTRERGREMPVVMVGDGVNDAAALASADVGIAVSGGAEASMAAADVYLAGPGLSGLVDLIATAKRCRRGVLRNLIVSLGYNASAISLAAAGLVTPLVAAVLMPISSMVVLALAIQSQSGPVRPASNQKEVTA